MSTHLREEVESEVSFWAMMCHLSSFAGILGAPIPMGNILAPLAVWMIKGKDHPFIDDHGREVVNFQINMFIYYMIAIALCFVLIGIPLLIILPFVNIFMTIKAALRARDGYLYDYPLMIHFL